MTAGTETTLAFAVERAGRAVAVDPYLGARGHLVILREGDLAYLHTHADEEELRFDTTFPSAGRYRAFLQFSADGEDHTAAFTIEVEACRRALTAPDVAPVWLRARAATLAARFGSNGITRVPGCPHAHAR